MDPIRLSIEGPVTYSPVKMQLKFAEFTLEQKIFIVQSFYIYNLNAEQVRKVFEERFQVETADSICDTFVEIVQTFEAIGTTTDTQFHYEVVEKLN